MPDFESAADNGANNVYDVTVNVRDSLNDAGNTDTAVDDSIAVTVTVTNVDEDGTVTISGTLSGGEVLTASVTDIDGTITSLTWRWQREPSMPREFHEHQRGDFGMYTTVAADVGQKLKAIAMYTDPQGSGKTAEAETSGPIAPATPLRRSTTARRRRAPWRRTPQWGRTSETPSRPATATAATR